MPEFTIETTYHLPVFRHATYAADTAEAACRLAIEDNDWSGQREVYESSGETYVTGIWEGDDTAYRAPAIPVPPHFLETVQRQAAHFEILLGLLKMLGADDSFAGLTVDAVTDTDIHAACLSVAASIDLAEEVGGAEFRAAFAALRQAQLRRA
ncbi:hypothetical protein [Mesorhizobium sp.]|uniref:hypothetical protein n=1 Tax=Mesorhizobium sp. TaxID=1871066 RepID=UPI000FE61116|nr:hypothetical protein [Mesorhizobium sp.]RWG34982.1 MAG: hypothetical protein EOQ61_03955 [Mesorhizobium sp.]RWH29322.1 MAG: hypothetical protein EOQ77_03550 [Mesorhizobium sp.]TIR40950.1 MAG: hypothetical protein E5X27_03210 [Mesorhizobium sp.]